MGERIGAITDDSCVEAASLHVEHALPLVDTAVLHGLATSLENNELAVRFASDYIGLWNRRRRRLSAALGRGDFPASIDAVLSLRTASVMVGGVRLAFLAQRVEDAVNRGDFAAGEGLMAEVAACGADTIEELAMIRSELQT